MNELLVVETVVDAVGSRLGVEKLVGKHTIALQLFLDCVSSTSPR